MWKLLLSFILAAACSAQVFSPELIGSITPPASEVTPPAGYIIWLHADDPTGLFTNVAGTVQADASSAVGKFIGKWQDRSASGTNSVYMDTPGGSERRPALSNSVVAFNNKPALIFGNRDFTTEERTWLQTLTNNVTLGPTGITAFIVASKINHPLSAGDSFPMLFAHGFAGPKSWEMRVEGASGSTTTNIDLTDNNGLTTTAQGFRADLGYCWAFRGNNLDASNWQQFKNGVGSTAISYATDNFPAANGFAVGSRWITGARDNCWHGAIAEVIIYPWFMSDAELLSVNFYATNKYRLHDP